MKINSVNSSAIVLQIFNEKIDLFTQDPRSNVKIEYQKAFSRFQHKQGTASEKAKPNSKFLREYVRTLMRYTKVCLNASQERDFFKPTDLTYYKANALKFAEWIKIFSPILDRSIPEIKIPAI